MGLALTACCAWGRPGSGQDYDPGSSDSDSSGTSSSDSSDSSGSEGGGGGSGGFRLEDFFWIVPISLVVALSVHFGSRALIGRFEAARKARRDARRQAWRARCPERGDAALAQATGALMKRVNDAWVHGSMVPVRALLSDGVFVRFQAQLALNRLQGKRNVMSGWRLTDAHVLAGQATAEWEEVHVRLSATARDADVTLDASPEAAQASLARVRPTDYQEVWSLLRRTSASTDGNAEVGSGRCPKCGAPLVAAERVRCSACEALVNSGEHGWVLAEITQHALWRDKDPDAMGLEALMARDPLVSPQALKDRASVLFWKWLQARATGQRAGLDRFCLVPGQPAAPKTTLARPAVAEVKLSSARRRQGRAEVELIIIWSGVVDGEVIAGRWTWLVMARPDAARTHGGVSALDCPACKGPVGESDEASCRYCGAPLRPTEGEWSLLSVS